MLDRMIPLSFDALMRWALADELSAFSVPFAAPAKERPIGPAAGPHTQLAQNIVSAYAAGARFFELKTVQTLDGEDLPVEKPCILASDEGFNVEWSTELTVPEAYEEYVKAYFALKLLCKVRGLGAPDGFQFNMSVGYDLAGIKSEKIDSFIEGMKDAGATAVWQACQAWAQANMALLPGVDAAYPAAISPAVCTQVTLSTLHGCPPAEIERIAAYLITEKRLTTFIKCNPTLLGYEFARTRLDKMGFVHLQFDDHHFKNDLQYADAVPMLRRLKALAEAYGVSFGVKLTNTFPLKIAAGELPGQEMYMSGRALFALSTHLAAKLSAEFGGALRISYSGGADALNIAALYQAGIHPITVATTLLKPGGYRRFAQMAAAVANLGEPQTTVNTAAVERINAEAVGNPRYHKPTKPLPTRKNGKKVPLLSCTTAPCQGGCPIEQDVPEYIRLMGEGKALEALRVITEKNPLPSITGTICNHRCQGRCRRNFYDDTIHIRGVKKLAAERAMDALLTETKPPVSQGAPVAVVGGGPAGMAAAVFLRRAGVPVTLFEKTGALGGTVRNVIPRFRIPQEAIERDAALLTKLGVTVKLNHPVTSLAELRGQGYKEVVLAIGATKRGALRLAAGAAMNAIDFLERTHDDSGAVSLGKHAVVVGGGNTAMDAARAAMRVPGVETVSIVYRRDMANMPADEEELRQASEDGVKFLPLLSPVSLENGMLTCRVMRLGDADKSGRRQPVETDEITHVPADTVIAAVGEKADEALYAAMGADDNTYFAGDGKSGPATVVEAIAGARDAAKAILAARNAKQEAENAAVKTSDAAQKKGWLMPYTADQNENYRCLSCDAVCSTCVDVCPNRANIEVQVNGQAQIVHIESFCNHCGNCEAFCPYDSAPYKEKFTLFHNKQDFDDSAAPGLYAPDGKREGAQIRAGEDVSALVDALLEDKIIWLR